MKRLFQFVVFLLLVSILNAQPRHHQEERPQTGPKPIYLESHIIPNDSSKICFVSYRIPYSNLVFIKNGNEFTGGLTLRIEATSEDGVEVRESTSDKITLTDYDETLDDTKFLQGILKFDLDKDNLTINPLVELHNTDRQVPLRPFKVDNNLQEIISVEKTNANCEKSTGYKLNNYENAIPFSDKNYQLLFSVYDSDVKEINVEISQKDDIIVDKNLSPSFLANISYEKCDREIIVANKQHGVSANIFVLDDFSYKLDEGKALVKVTDSEKNVLFSSELEVIWTNKPRTLNNPEYAFELLDIVESEDNLDTILDKANDDYLSALKIFWEKYDPNKKTPFNQLMFEFYSRADKALTKYTSTGDRFGSLTDRGKIYIKYGQPNKVDRFYTEKNEIAEVWEYNSPKMEFVFVDASGLGNYKLVN